MREARPFPNLGGGPWLLQLQRGQDSRERVGGEMRRECAHHRTHAGEGP